MCGIAGILNHAARPEARSELEQACDRLARRGPDGAGLWQDDQAMLGHRRLAVIDLETGGQPMLNETGSLALIANGEIYNCAELRSELLKKGHRFASSSDSEVILHGFEEYGEAIFGRLDGMFAAALYDRSERQLWLVRDPLGQKPLVWFRQGERLYFASTLHALKSFAEFPRRNYRREGFGDFLSYWYVPGPETIYRGVYKLPPGHWMRCSPDGGSEIRRYFSLDFSVKHAGGRLDLITRTRFLLDRAVRKRLMSDVPLGVFLSGGLDSMIVTGLMLKAGVRDLTICSMGSDEAAYDELAEVRRSLDHFRRIGLDSWRAHEKIVRPDDLGPLRELWKEYGEPFGDASLLPTALLCRFAREHMTVALSGDGADEFFGGYERYLAMRFFRKVDWLPAGLRRGVLSALARLLPDGGERSSSGKLKRLFELGRFRELERYYHLMNKAEQSEKRRLAPELGESDSGRDYLLGVLGSISSRDPVERYAEADLTTYLANDILPKIDTASMSYGLEVRSPFLDRDLAMWSAGLPWSLKQRGRSRKDVLKRACADWLPAEVGRRPKKGFGVPVARYLDSVWRPELERQLLDGPLVRDGWIDRAAAASLLERRDRAAVNLQWGLLAFGVFLENDREG